MSTKSKNKKKTTWSPPSWHTITLYALLLISLNLVDALLTAIWFNSGIITEINPLTEYFLKISLHHFFFFKMTVIIGLSIFLSVFSRQKRLAYIGLQLTTLCYLGLVIYELIFKNYLSI